jgi:isopentenyl-diphosphate delta-isomerase type 1
MKLAQLLKTLLPGLLPLLVFILADEICGTKIGLYIAIIVGIIQLTFIYAKEKRIDTFVIFDTALIVVMGFISIILENDIFFKLKPGIIETILVLILGISAYSPRNVIMSMTQRYLNGIEINHSQQKQMLRSIKIFFWLLFVHTCLVFFSALFMSKQAWAFISTGLLYIILVVFVLYELVRNLIQRKKYNKTNCEFLPHIDENGNIIGKIKRIQAHDGTKLLHPVIHVHIFDYDNNVLLQKRSANKEIQPDKWDTAVGGHVSYGEPVEKTVERETKEELGIAGLKFSYLTRYIWTSDIESELVFVFAARISEIKFVPNSEVDEVRFWSFDKIKKSIGKNVFTPNFEIEFDKILKNIKIK